MHLSFRCGLTCSFVFRWYNVVKGGKETGKVLLEFSYN